MVAGPKRRDLLIMAALILSVFGGCLYLGYRFQVMHFHIVSVVSTGIITFFGFLGRSVINQSTDQINDREMRVAITAALVSMYVVIVGIGAFLNERAGDMPEISKTLLTSFTTVVGIVVAFYFGSSAYLEGRDHKRRRSETNDN